MTTRVQFGLAILLIAAAGHSVSTAAEPKPGETIENSLKMKLVYIPPGGFDMGTPESERARQDDEKLHHVKLSKGFYMSAHEVTQGQFQRVLGRNPSWFSKEGGGKSSVSGQNTATLPVEQVTWFDAAEFCNALSKSEGLPEYYTLRAIKREEGTIMSAEVTENGGKGYRLPSEAQWEYACRAGSKKPFHFGDVLNGKEANVDGTEPYGTSTKGVYLERTCTVGSYPTNAFGLYDMHGNVWEWCNDWYAVYGDDVGDPKGPDSGTFRVLRGGAWRDYALDARAANRRSQTPGVRVHLFGFRVVAPRTP